jgi:hypothetical protein
VRDQGRFKIGNALSKVSKQWIKLALRSSQSLQRRRKKHTFTYIFCILYIYIYTYNFLINRDKNFFIRAFLASLYKLRPLFQNTLPEVS